MQRVTSQRLTRAAFLLGLLGCALPLPAGLIFAALLLPEMSLSQESGVLVWGFVLCATGTGLVTRSPLFGGVLMFAGAVVEYLSYSDSGLGLAAWGQPFFVPCFLGGFLAIASVVLARTMLDKPAGALTGSLGAPAFVEPADHGKRQRWVRIHVAVIALLIVLGFLPRLVWELRFLAQPDSQALVVSLQGLLTGNVDSLEARAALFVLRLLAVDAIYALASICLALGLLRYKSWARTVSMVFAAVWLALEGPGLLHRTAPWSSVWVVFASAYALGILLLPGVAKAFSRRVP